MAPTETVKSQYERFKQAAHDIGSEGTSEDSRRPLARVAKAPGAKAKKAAKKRKALDGGTMSALAPKMWRAIAFWGRVEIMLLTAMIIIGLAVRLA